MNFAQLRSLLTSYFSESELRNLCFDGTARVAHATDASDWRVAHPLAVFTPDSETELPPLLRKCLADYAANGRPPAYLPHPLPEKET